MKQFFDYIESKYGETVKTYVYGRWCAEDITAIWGYLLEFFDSVGIQASCFLDEPPNRFYWWVQFGSKHLDSFATSRTEAQQEAIKKAFDLLKNKEQ